MRIRSNWLPVFVAWCGWLLAAMQASAAVPSSGGRFEDAPGWASRFDSAGRDAWQKPDEVLRALALPPTAIVADIGSGTGYFALRLARAVPQGRVYGADTEPEMVRFLEQRAAAEKIANLASIQATRDSPMLPERVDLVLLVNVQGLVVNPGDYFARLRAMLKPQGRIAIIAYRPDAPFGAPASMRAAAEQVKRDMVRQGYALEADHGFLEYQSSTSRRRPRKSSTSRRPRTSG